MKPRDQPDMGRKRRDIGGNRVSEGQGQAGGEGVAYLMSDTTLSRDREAEIEAETETARETVGLRDRDSG
eukprot:876802-Rhodomonas_salina.1